MAMANPVGMTKNSTLVPEGMSLDAFALPSTHSSIASTTLPCYIARGFYFKYKE
jgi:hypothetical protein